MAVTRNLPDMPAGVQLAAKAFIEKMNRSGGLLGRKLVLKIVDDQSNLELSYAETKRIIEDPNNLLTIGISSSNIAVNIAPLYKKRNRIYALPYATNVRLGKIKGSVFQICFNDDLQSKILANFVEMTVKPKRILILTNKSDIYSDDLSTFFVKHLSHAFKIKSKQFSYADSKIPLDKIIKVIQRENPDLIFIPEIKVNAAIIVRTLYKNLDLSNITLLGGDGWGADHQNSGIFTAEMNSPRRFKFYYTDHWHKDINNALSRKDLQELTTKGRVFPNTGAMLTYEFLNRLAAIIRKRKTINRKLLIHDLRQTAYEGVTGHVRFASNGETIRAVALIELTTRGSRLIKLYNP